MNPSITKTVNGAIAVLFFVAAFVLQVNTAKAQSSANVSLNIEEITAHRTTSSDHKCYDALFTTICTNDMDETYFAVVGTKSNGEQITIPRISPSPPQDYYQFKDTWSKRNIQLWSGLLQPNEAVYLLVAVREQDNAQLDSIEKTVKGAALALGAIFVDPSLGSAALDELGAAGKSFVDSLSSDGDDTIGAFSVQLINDGHSTKASWMPISSTNIILQNNSSASMEARGAGAYYWLRANVNTKEHLVNSAGLCHDAVQGKIAWDYSGSTTWNETNITRLCAGREYSAQPARCFDHIMHSGVNWGGGTQWQWQNALNLCEGTTNADATISCFQSKIQQGQSWQNAIAACDERSSLSCHDAVQGKIAWDYSGSTTWNETNITRLCAGREYSAQPARCFDRIMHGGVNWGGGTQWQWQNALNLCEGTTNADATISCFQSKIQQGQSWQVAITACEQ